MIVLRVVARNWCECKEGTSLSYASGEAVWLGCTSVRVGDSQAEVVSDREKSLYMYLQQVSDRRNGLDESRGIFLEGFGINRNMEKQGRLKETVIFHRNIEYIYIVLVCFVDVAGSFEIARVCAEQHECRFNFLTSDV
jgi:hypothetical protein